VIVAVGVEIAVEVRCIAEAALLLTSWLCWVVLLTPEMMLVLVLGFVRGGTVAPAEMMLLLVVGFVRGDAVAPASLVALLL